VGKQPRGGLRTNSPSEVALRDAQGAQRGVKPVTFCEAKGWTLTSVGADLAAEVQAGSHGATGWKEKMMDAIRRALMSSDSMHLQSALSDLLLKGACFTAPVTVT
jgi:hypothetical protein